MSVTEEELPAVQTPTTIDVSPLGSTHGNNNTPPPDNHDGPSSELTPPTDTRESNQMQEPLPEIAAPPPHALPVTKVQPFFSGETRPHSHDTHTLTLTSPPPGSGTCHW